MRGERAEARDDAWVAVRFLAKESFEGLQQMRNRANKTDSCRPMHAAARGRASRARADVALIARLLQVLVTLAEVMVSSVEESSSRVLRDLARELPTLRETVARHDGITRRAAIERPSRGGKLVDWGRREA